MHRPSDDYQNLFAVLASACACVVNFFLSLPFSFLSMFRFVSRHHLNQFFGSSFNPLTFTFYSLLLSTRTVHHHSTTSLLLPDNNILSLADHVLLVHFVALVSLLSYGATMLIRTYNSLRLDQFWKNVAFAALYRSSSVHEAIIVIFKTYHSQWKVPIHNYFLNFSLNENVLQKGHS